jgi:hypothetical protein
MAHFAKINELTNEVEQLIVINNSDLGDLPFPQSEPVGQGFIQNIIGLSGVWKQTSYNNSFRVRYAGLGYIYDQTNDLFIPPKPYPSWVLNQTSWNWESPIPYPTDGQDYIWNEDVGDWVLFSYNEE